MAMTWNIPEPQAVYWPVSLTWAGWWRSLTLCCVAVVLAGCGVYFWLQDSRALMYAFITVMVLILLFIAIAGWRMFRYGVALEQADATEQYNTQQKLQWQAWAQQGLAVLDFSAIFPSEVRAPQMQKEPVSSSKVFLLPEYQGAEYLFTELLVPLCVALRVFTQHHRLTVCLPEGCTPEDWQIFQTVWEKLLLPVSALLSPVYTPDSLLRQLSVVSESNNAVPGWLVIRLNWHRSDKGTQGAIAWLIAGGSVNSSMPVSCTLHRPLPSGIRLPDEDIDAFLQYQCVSHHMAGLWYDKMLQPQMDRLLITLSQTRKSNSNSSVPDATPSPSQHYLPHWLGEAERGSDWFAVTLAMQMSVFSASTQVLALGSGSDVFLMSISAGGKHVA